jgi:hypothetical protein
MRDLETHVSKPPTTTQLCRPDTTTAHFELYQHVQHYPGELEDSHFHCIVYAHVFRRSCRLMRRVVSDGYSKPLHLQPSKRG